MRVSYAQRLEDFHLSRVFSDCDVGVYVDVGGGHPVADNVSYHFYLEGWRGLVVEPQRHLAELYAQVRPRDLVLDCLVGRAEQDIAFHVVDKLHGFSTTVEQHAVGAGQFGAGYSTQVRRSRPLAALLDEAGLGVVNFLKIDVEGAEADVLLGADLSRHRPQVLCIESVAPGSMEDTSGLWEPLLTQQAYEFAFFDGLNRFYVAREHASLRARFPVEAADWGVVKHLYEFGRVHEEPEHPDRALALRLIKGFLSSVTALSEREILALLSRSAPGGGLEPRPQLQALLRGKLGASGGLPSSGDLLDDEARAALGRIAAQYDGGMISDEV